MDPNVPSQHNTTSSSIPPSSSAPEHHEAFVAPQGRFSFSGITKIMSIGLGGLVLVVGLGAAVLSSQQRQEIRQHASTSTSSASCVGTRSGGGTDKYDDPNGPYVSCAIVSNCTGTTCTATVRWQEKTRTTANEYKVVIAPSRPGKSGTYELLTFKNATSAVLTGFKQGQKYVLKVSAWPNGVFRFGYGTPYYTFTPAATVQPSPTPTKAPTPSVSPTTKPSVSPTAKPSTSPSPTTTQKLGDINGDGKVDIVDYQLLIACYGDKFSTDSCTAGSAADLNEDGAVDGVDYNIFLRAMIGQ